MLKYLKHICTHGISSHILWTKPAYFSQLVGKMSFLLFLVHPKQRPFLVASVWYLVGGEHHRWHDRFLGTVKWEGQVVASGLRTYHKAIDSGKWGFSKVWLTSGLRIANDVSCKRTCFLCSISNFVSWWECTELILHIYLNVILHADIVYHNNQVHRCLSQTFFVLQKRYQPTGSSRIHWDPLGS